MRIRDKSSCILWFIRHGESTWNEERRFQGQSNPPLSSTGLKQAHALRERLAKSAMTFDAVYSSDLDRAIQTAKIASPQSNIVIDTRIRERKLGILEGKRVDELSSIELQNFNAWKNDPENVQPIGGETFTHLKKRAKNWINSLPKQGSFIAYLHSGVIKAIIYEYLCIPSSPKYELLIENISITKVKISKRKKTFVTINDTAHWIEATSINERSSENQL